MQTANRYKQIDNRSRGVSSICCLLFAPILEVLQ